MKKNRNKLLLLFALSAAIIGGILFFYVYKEHRDISSEEASFTISVDELHKQFQTNDIPNPYKMGISHLYPLKASERKQVEGMKKALKPKSNKK